MNWRNSAFWILDFFKGSGVRKAYKDIKANYNNYNKNNEDEKISKLLYHVTKTTNFYSNYENKDIIEFPIVDKNIIKSNFNNIVSNKYKVEKLHKMSTSGSTGNPFVVYQNKEKRRRVIAEIMFFNDIVGYYFGEKQIYCRVWNEKNRKNKFIKFIQNIETYDISNLCDENINNLYKLLEKKKIKNILSYSSTLDVVSNLNVDTSNLKVKSIVSGAATLSLSTRKKLKKIFNCNIVSRYSNQKNGILAQDTDRDYKFVLNTANYYYEFLKMDSNEPALEGEISRLIITDLYNYAEPMIRYDTGDTCIFKIENNKKVITEIYGRKIDLIYNVKGEIMSPHVITKIMASYIKIEEFQFIQKANNKYQLNLKCKHKINDNLLREEVGNVLGNNIELKIEYVKEIPKLQSGKRKYIENRMVK